jgi:hypothetical protein
LPAKAGNCVDAKPLATTKKEKMKTILSSIIFLLITINLNGQSKFVGKQYIGEGTPLRWFYLETETKGIFYSKGDVGFQELEKVKIDWKEKNDNSIILTIQFEKSPETFELFFDKDKDYFQDKEGLEIFHRRKQITIDGITFKE